MAATARIPTGRLASGASTTIGNARPIPNASPIATPTDGIADGEADAGERPGAEAEDERRESQAQQDPVERRGHRQRHAPAPGLGELPPHLRHDPHAADLGHGRDGRDRGGEDVGELSADPVDELAEGPQQAEGEDAARQRARGGRWRRRRSSSASGRNGPRRPSVSIIENPHGDHVPVSPIGTAASARTIASVLTSTPSAWDLRLVVGDAEDLARPVAVPVQRGVAVDALVVVGAAVPELADRPAAAAVPGSPGGAPRTRRGAPVSSQTLVRGAGGSGRPSASRRRWPSSSIGSPAWSTSRPTLSTGRPSEGRSG